MEGRLFLVGALVVGMAGTSGCRILRRPDPPPAPPEPVERELRLPPRGSPLTLFEQTAGWRAESETGRAEIRKNASKAIWGEYAGELRFTPESEGPHEVVLILDEPWRVHSMFNILTLWVRDEGAPGFRPDHEVRVIARDREGEEHEWPLTYAPGEGWQMLHKRWEEGFPWPADIERLVWRIPEGESGSRVLWLEAVSAYQESLSRIPRDIQFIRPHDYAPAFAPKREGSVLLDFPPRPHAFRPRSEEARYVTTVRQQEPGVYLFEYRDESERLGYEVRDRPGGPEVRVYIDGESWPDLWRGLQVEGEGAVDIRYGRIEEGTLHLQYARGLRVEMSLHGRSLQVEAHSLSETFEAVDFGSMGAGGDIRSEPLYFPLMRTGRGNRHPVMRLRRGETQRFASVIPDWWFSMGGVWEVGPRVRGRESVGRILYPPRWKGSRNVFRERVYFTVSPRVEEVLPSPAGVRAIHRDRAAHLLHPGERGENAVAVWKELELLGVRPTSPDWREALLARKPNGDWRAFEPQRFVLKSARFFDTALRWALEAPFGREAWMIRDGAEEPPWRLTDYDARVLGAGTYAQAWAELGVLLQQVAAELGAPLIAPGGNEWLISGFVAGVVPEFALGFQELHPYLPHFAQRNILPFSVVHGLGPTRDFRLAGETGREERVMHRQIAAQIAYGACGRLPEVEDPALLRRAAMILGPLHQRLSADRFVRLAYWSGERFLSLEEALEEGVFRRSQMYFGTREGAEIWVNGDLHGNWRMRVDSLAVELPPSGFVYRDESLVMLHALTRSGVPFTAMMEGKERWVDSPYAAHDFGGIRVRGFARVRPALGGEPAEIFLEGDVEGFRLAPEAAGMAQVGEVRAETADGREIGEVRVSMEDDAFVVEAEEAPRRILLFPAAREALESF